MESLIETWSRLIKGINRAATKGKGWGEGIFPGYYEHHPQLIL